MFLIGARINNKLQLIRSIKDLGGRKGMKYKLDYLTEHPEKGLLGYEMSFPVIVPYWRSFEQLEAFAKDGDDPHLEPWRQFWRRVGKSGRTGIWHETYLVRDGEYETVYGNMPPKGLGKASRLVRMGESASPTGLKESTNSSWVVTYPPTRSNEGLGHAHPGFTTRTYQPPLPAWAMPVPTS